MEKYFLNTNADDLSTRSQNIIRELGGVESAIAFYKRHNSFRNLRNVGKYADEELSDFCNYHLYKEEQKVIEEIKRRPDVGNEKRAIVKCLLLYQSEKRVLGKRTKTVLSNLESGNDYHNGLDDKTAYLKKYFLNGFDFMELRGIGQTSIVELECLKAKILKSNVGLWITEPEPKDFFESIQLRINAAFGMDFTYNEIEELFDDRHGFTKLFCIAIFNYKYANEKFLSILERKYFNEGLFTEREIAAEFNCTRERIRQITERIGSFVIPQTINRTQEITGAKTHDLAQTTGINFVRVSNFSHFTFRNREYKPNAAFTRAVYEELLKKDYTHIDRFILKSFKSFLLPAAHLFVSNKYAEDVKLEQLLIWLDRRIYKLESASLEYDTEELIKTFYTEHDIAIEVDWLPDVKQIVSYIKRQDIAVKQWFVQRKNNKAMVDEARVFLLAKNEMQRTKAIVNHLSEKGYQVKTNMLNIYLRNAKDIFSCFGMGNWTLNEWNTNGVIMGSIRTIVRTLLLNSNDPIHLSEIYNYINAFKKVSLHSIRTNLKSHEYNIFKAFNCNYFGLTEKQYEEHWYKIPPYKSVSLVNHFKRLQNETDAIKYLNSKYGYPEQQIRFMVDLKVGRYGELRNGSPR